MIRSPFPLIITASVGSWAFLFKSLETRRRLETFSKTFKSFQSLETRRRFRNRRLGVHRLVGFFSDRLKQYFLHCVTNERISAQASRIQEKDQHVQCLTNK